jgi:hypothetical protein
MAGPEDKSAGAALRALDHERLDHDGHPLAGLESGDDQRGGLGHGRLWLGHGRLRGRWLGAAWSPGRAAACQSVQIVHNVVALPVEPRRVLPTRNQASKPPGDLVEGRRLSGDMLRW